MADVESILSISRITFPDENGNNTSYKIKDTELWKKVGNISKEIFNELYPVGSLYWTTNQSFDPNTYFRGKWEPIQDCYIRAANRKEIIKDSTGFISFGDDERILERENLPKHNHEATGGTHSHGLHMPSNSFSPGNISNKANLVRTGTISQGVVIEKDNPIGFYIEDETPKITILDEGENKPFDNRPKSINAYCWQRIN